MLRRTIKHAQAAAESYNAHLGLLLHFDFELS